MPNILATFDIATSSDEAQFVADIKNNISDEPNIIVVISKGTFQYIDLTVNVMPDQDN